MKRDGCDSGRVAAGKLSGEEDVGGFAGAVAGPGAERGEVRSGHDGLEGGGHVVGFAAEGDDADV